MTGNKEYKSDVFSMLMEDPYNALELYNALNGTNYTNPEIVEMCRLDGGVSLTVRNDAAFVLDMRLSIYEHQSTVCPNMPLRSFIYLAIILQDMIKGHNIYGNALVKIPTSQFAIFYNGEARQPECYEMKLSDAFEHPIEDPDLELKCTVYNINYGKNKELLEKCSFLRKYMVFVDYVRDYHREYGFNGLQYAIDRAIDRCINEDVLADFFKERRSEVVKAMVLDYTFERQLTLERKDRLEEGHAKGLAEGMAEGRAEGLAEGLAEGRAEGHAVGCAEGKMLQLIEQSYKKYSKGYTAEETAEMLEESMEMIGSIYRVIEKAGTDDVNEIYNLLK